MVLGQTARFDSSLTIHDAMPVRHVPDTGDVE
jgi:hypothetical protein